MSGAGFSDAAEVSLPVWTPATSEAFATYGELDAGVAVQPIAAPENVFPQFGGLEISSSSTALHALTDAFLYLWQYPYEVWWAVWLSEGVLCASLSRVSQL